LRLTIRKEKQIQSENQTSKKKRKVGNIENSINEFFIVSKRIIKLFVKRSGKLKNDIKNMVENLEYNHVELIKSLNGKEVEQKNSVALSINDKLLIIGKSKLKNYWKMKCDIKLMTFEGQLRIIDNL
jgi:hypothetical protein